MSCEGALRREFPDRAALLPNRLAEDAEFLGNLFDAIRKLDAEEVPLPKSKSKKDIPARPGEGGTSSPVLITGMIIDIVAGLGKSVKPKRIVKRSREQVNWENDSQFHRAPTWLLLRAATRLVLDRIETANTGEGMSCYKQVMAYHHGRILRLAVRSATSMPSDTLMTMQAKLARRIMKLNPSQHSAWLDDISETLTSSQKLLDNRWRGIQHADATPLPLDELPRLKFRRDCELKLNNFRKHLEWIQSRSAPEGNSTGPGDLTTLAPTPNTRLPVLSATIPEDPTMNLPELLEFEAWVESTLPNFVLQLEGQAIVVILDALRELDKLTKAYRSRATSSYVGIPEAMSIMHLAILELWIAMDRVAGMSIPLLLRYDPGFKPCLVNGLLLESKKDMKRLKAVENYLSERKRKSPIEYTSAFTDFGHGHSFAAQYYLGSSRHQKLHRDIERWAREKAQRKADELASLKRQYTNLACTVARSECHSRWNEDLGLYVHETKTCKRCLTYAKMDLSGSRFSSGHYPKTLSWPRLWLLRLTFPRPSEYGAISPGS